MLNLHPVQATAADSTEGQPPADQVGRFLTTKRIHDDLGICRRTLGLRLAIDPDFPKPTRINGRLYFREVEFENYKRMLVHRAIARGAGG